MVATPRRLIWPTENEVCGTVRALPCHHSRIGVERLEPAWVVFGERRRAFDDVKRGALLRARLGEAQAAVGESYIYLPCRSGLYTYPLHGGTPKAKPWDHLQEGGNVVVLSETILVAGNNRITSYGLRENVFARLQARMDEDPRDAWAALNMAEVAYRTAFSQPSPSARTADYHRAEQALAEAIRRAGGDFLTRRGLI